MGYRQYTSCVQPIFYIDVLHPWRTPAFHAYVWFGALIAAIIAGLITAYNIVSVPIVIGLVLLAILFLTWWLYGRLICLGGERCCIGAALGRPSSKPGPTDKFGDDDASFNVLLAPNPVAIKPALVDAIPKETYTGSIQGELTKEQFSVLQIGRGYVDDTEHIRKYIKSLHCEFEGSGIRNLLAWLNVILAILIALLAVLVLVPPPAGPILALILWLLAGLMTVLGLGTAWYFPLNPGDPTDVNPNLGELRKGQIVIVKGDWVYDSLHAGWNEIHAIHACQIIGCMEIVYEVENGENIQREFAPWPADLGVNLAQCMGLPMGAPSGLGLDTPDKVKDAVAFWCAELGRAQDAEDGGSRTDPEHNWTVHPLVDGCSRVIIT